MGYFGPLNIKEINGVRIGALLWIDKDDLKWIPGQEIATIDPTHPSQISITVGIKSQIIKQDEIPDVVSKLRDSDKDVDMGEVIITREALKGVTDELEGRFKRGF
jgi:hypothetical protein